MTRALLSQHPDHAEPCESCRAWPACVLLPTALGWDVAQCQQCWARLLAQVRTEREATT